MSTDLKTSVKRARTLPPRQRQVLICLARGLCIKETADELSISESTVKQARVRIYSILQVQNDREATRIACHAHLVTLVD